MMIDSPRISVTVLPDSTWSADGPLADRACTISQDFARCLPANSIPPHRISIGGSAGEHVGLGTGTQLALAVASALAASARLPQMEPAELARMLGRGQRSAIGVHGFLHGGFLVDAGKARDDELAPLIARHPVPLAWRVLLVIPPLDQGLHGHVENEVFERLAGRKATPGLTDALCRLVLLGMLPALADEDLQAFGEAVYEFNRRVGEVFQGIQGGPYRDHACDLVRFLRQQGVYGVGQSSWGPAVFAILDNGQKAAEISRLVASHFDLRDENIIISSPANSGARLDFPTKQDR
jgi:beta-RFAP synthase